MHVDRHCVAIAVCVSPSIVAVRVAGPDELTLVSELGHHLREALAVEASELHADRVLAVSDEVPVVCALALVGNSGDVLASVEVSDCPACSLAKSTEQVAEVPLRIDHQIC